MQILEWMEGSTRLALLADGSIGDVCYVAHNELQDFTLETNSAGLSHTGSCKTSY